MSRQSKRDVIEELVYEFRASQVASDQIDDISAAALGINRTDSRCLDIVDYAGPITAGHLAEQSGLTTGAVTAVLDRLERAGYVRRMRDTADRRRVLVEATDELRRRAMEFYGPISEEATRSMDGYTLEQLTLMLDFLRRGRELQEAQLARLRSRGKKT
jgi:DNA-binding MarR family transcriptional regulator